MSARRRARTFDLRRTNLTALPTPLLGRERELKVARGLLLGEEVRLLTLTGPGGSGKTRLALQVAADLLEAFEDGVYFVDLAPISEPGLVVSTIAGVLKLQESAGSALQESVIALTVKFADVPRVPRAERLEVAKSEASGDLGGQLRQPRLVISAENNRRPLQKSGLLFLCRPTPGLRSGSVPTAPRRRPEWA